MGVYYKTVPNARERKRVADDAIKELRGRKYFQPDERRELEKKARNYYGY